MSSKNVGCLLLIALYTIFIFAVGFYDVYKVAQLAARAEIKASQNK